MSGRGNVWRNQSDQTDDPAKRVGRAFVGINERQQHRGGIREEGEAAWCKTVSGKKVLFVSRGIWELSVFRPWVNGVWSTGTRPERAGSREAKTPSK